MKKITAEVKTVGFLTELEKNQFTEWMWNGMPLNMFDPEVVAYPKTLITKASNEDGDLLYIPLQAALVFDAIAAKPGITPRQEALALWRIGEVTNQLARDTGHREIYFFCRDDRVSDICSNHDFEEIKGVRVLRRKVKP
jgi:hypothetical protein